MQALRRVLQPISSRINALLGRAVLDSVDDSGGMQLIKVSGVADEVIEKIPHPQPFGLSSMCPAGGQVVVAFIGGARDQGVAVVVDSTQHRKKGLSDGETAVYSSAGTYIYLKADGTIEIHSDKVHTSGDLADSTGTLDKVRQDLAALKNWASTHTHTAPTGGGATTPPIVPPT